MKQETQAVTEAPVPADKAPRSSWKAVRVGLEALAQAGAVPPVPEFPMSNVTYTKLCNRLAEAALAQDKTMLTKLGAAITGKQTYAVLTRHFAEACLQAVEVQLGQVAEADPEPAPTPTKKKPAAKKKVQAPVPLAPAEDDVLMAAIKAQRTKRAAKVAKAKTKEVSHGA